LLVLALESQAVASLRFVHCRPPESARFSPRRGDILEMVPALRLAVAPIPGRPDAGAHGPRRSEVGQRRRFARRDLCSRDSDLPAELFDTICDLAWRWRIFAKPKRVEQLVD